MKCKVDENLPQDVVDLLSEAGQDALSVLDQGLGGENDQRIFSVCQRQERVLVTLDLDFSNVQEYPLPASTSAPVTNPGIWRASRSWDCRYLAHSIGWS